MTEGGAGPLGGPPGTDVAGLPTAGAPALGAPDFGYAWVTKGSVADFVARMKAMREGDPATGGPHSGEPTERTERADRTDREDARPAAAIRALHAFALRRPIAELVQPSGRSGGGAVFDRGDLINVLATAAVCRSVPEAAELAVGQWKRERAERAAGVSGAARDDGTLLSDIIVHDVACQRTSLDVAAFVAACRRDAAHDPGPEGGGAGELAERTVRVFAEASSGRTHLDKALLYIALRDEGCLHDADTLLQLTMDAIDVNSPVAQASDPGPAALHDAELHDLVGALHQLSPSERILEKWFEGQLTQARRVTRTVQVVARLIAARPDGSDTLVEHVGTRWPAPELLELCSRLQELSPRRCAAVRAYAASRTAGRELADLVVAWHTADYAPLARTTKDLLADIVAGGAGATGPRSLTALEGLGEWLVRSSPRCSRLLWQAAAVHVDGRTGRDLATALRRVPQGRERWRAARKASRRLAVRVLTDETAMGLFIEYAEALRQQGLVDECGVARKELADPTDFEGTIDGGAARIARIAGHLHGDGRTRATGGWDLLERCLENEQRISAKGVAVVVAQLRSSTMRDEDRCFLLRATVGRWSDVHGRHKTVEELRARGFTAEATEIIRSLR